MQVLLLYSILSAALFYLGARAQITSFLWSRYPGFIARWADCAACSGAWYGAAIALTLGRYQNLGFMGLDSYDWLTPIVVGLSTMITTPIVAAVMARALQDLGTAVPEELLETPDSPLK